MLNKQKSIPRDRKKTIKMRSKSNSIVGQILTAENGSASGKNSIHPDYTKKVNR